MSARAGVVACAWVFGCAADPADATSTSLPTPSATTIPTSAELASAAPTSAELASAAPSSSAVTSGSATWSTQTRRNSPREDPAVGDRCTTNEDCAWEDPCDPDRCVGVHEALQDRKCTESLPAKGRCECVEAQCSLAPNGALTDKNTKTEGTSLYCAHTECVLDRSRGACEGEVPSAPPNLRSRAPVQQGPGCVCVPGDKISCKTFWVEPVPCKTELDCWVAEDPFRHPVARPKNKRAPFKPCRDGSVQPVCSEQGSCRLGSAYKC